MKNKDTINNPLIDFAREMAKKVSRLGFDESIDTVYNPLKYAWNGHAEYTVRFGGSPKKVLFLGINPGPWGMTQTGVPFGEIDAVKNWMGIETEIGKPQPEHPKRPIEGFNCEKSEVSGRRLWGLMKTRFGTAEAFFKDHYVANYCPLVFMGETGKNITPDKLPAQEREELFKICDAHLVKLINWLEPEWLIGVGKFAEKQFLRLKPALAQKLQEKISIGTVLHPSPASPAANRGWDEAAIRQLTALGVWET